MTEQREYKELARRNLQCYVFEGGCMFIDPGGLSGLTREQQRQQQAQETTGTPRTACSSSELEATVKIK